MSELKIGKEFKRTKSVSEILGTDDWECVEVITESMLIDIVMDPFGGIGWATSELCKKGMLTAAAPQIGHILTKQDCFVAAALASDNVSRAVSLIDEFFKAGKAYTALRREGKWLISSELIQQDLEAKARTEAYVDAWYKEQSAYREAEWAEQEAKRLQAGA